MCHARFLTKQFQSYCNKSISGGSVTSVDQVEPFFLDFQSVPGLRSNVRNQDNVLLHVCYYYKFCSFTSSYIIIANI